MASSRSATCREAGRRGRPPGSRSPADQGHKREANTKTEATEKGTLETWTVEEVAEAFDRGEIAVIDVRTPQECILEHVPGALLMPMNDFEPTKLPVGGRNSSSIAARGRARRRCCGGCSRPDAGLWRT
jgi:uncharacterized OB-fold protein